MRRWFGYGLWTLVLVGSTGTTFGQLTDAERQGLERALFVGNMTLRDLEWERKPFTHRHRSSLIDLAMDRPVEAADRLLGHHTQALSLSPERLIELVRSQMLDYQKPPALFALNPERYLDAVPEELGPMRPSIANLLSAIKMANEEIRMATEALTAAERRLLIESLPGIAAEEPAVRFAFAQNPTRDRRLVFELARKVDLERMTAAAASLAHSVEHILPDLQRHRAAVTLTGIVRFGIDGMPVVIGGHGSNVHTDTDAMLTLDLGGNNRYVGRHGAGVGYASVLIDLDGDDVYDVGDLSVGAGLLGVGLAYDMGGNDTYRGGSITFGCGLLGVGMLYDRAGDDTYSGIALTQGFGQFGLGLLIDEGGDDRYGAMLYAQGAGRTQGVGWLVDRSGDDVYRAGGLSLNTPLFRDVHYSFAQGFGSGYREDTGGEAGGIGMLTDGAGNDAYIAETYAQAASYWFSLGSLFDETGHDTYSAYHYAQASAMHMTAAYLFDLAGDDAYVLKFGAGHAIGHDYGVAFLLDRSGNDLYAGRDSRPGLGNANGLGIFIDAGGEDRYGGPPGWGNPSRGSGSLGVFVDLGGADLYRAGIEDDQAGFGGTWGVALDMPTMRTARTEEPAPSTPVPVQVGSDPKPEDAELARIYARATQWGVGTALGEVEESLARLARIGMPAFDWMLANRLATADRLQLRAFTHMIDAIGGPARQALAPKVVSPDAVEAGNALTLVVNSRIIEAAPYMVSVLQNPAQVRMAARAAGVVFASDGGATEGRSEVVAELMTIAGRGDRMAALNAVIALGDITDAQSYSTGEALLGHPDLPIRKAAIRLVAKFPSQAKATAARLVSVAEERSVRIGIALYAEVGDSDSLRAVARFLRDSRGGVRIEALRALDGRCPPDFIDDIRMLRRDPDPIVRAVASRIDPGRG